MNTHQKNLSRELALVFFLVMATVWTLGLWPIIHRCAEVIIALIFVRRFWIDWKEKRTDGGNIWTDAGLCVVEKDAKRFLVGLGWFFGWLLLALILIAVVGALIAPKVWQAPDFLKKINRISFAYFVGVILQELLLQGYFTNQANKILPERPKLVALVLGLLFAIAHLPNLLLAGATFAFAFTSTFLFLTRCRNLYLMCFAHLIMSQAFKLLIAVPILGHGPMRVGPIFWN